MGGQRQGKRKRMGEKRRNGAEEEDKGGKNAEKRETVAA